MGYEPVLSEHADVLFDPRLHTHASCVREVPNADVMVLLIGSRFGGEAVPEALSLIDFDAVGNKSSRTTILDEPEKISVTQAEVIKAVELGTPLFAFVDSKVYAEHHVYETNKSAGISSKIKYPSIEKQQSAPYIFEFINFITHRVSNNAIVPFSGFSDIESHLVKQWSMLFQRLLQEQREKTAERRRSDLLVEQLQDLKAVVLQSISGREAREIARSVLKFRRIADFVLGINLSSNKKLEDYKGTIYELMSEVGIERIESEDDTSSLYNSYLIKRDGTFFLSRFTSLVIAGAIAKEWEEFKNLDKTTKVAVLLGVADTSSTLPMIRYRAEQFDDYKRSKSEERRGGNIFNQEVVSASVPITKSSGIQDAVARARARVREAPAPSSEKAVVRTTRAAKAKTRGAKPRAKD